MWRRPKFLQYLLTPRSAWHGRSSTFRRKLRNGVIHIGANVGPARHAYARDDLNVLWIEPDPKVFAELVANIGHLPKQRALNHLVVDVDRTEHRFHVSSNRGLSSSILPMAGVRDIWPDVTVVETLTLVGRTLPSILEEEGIDPDDYDGLVLDTEGTELLVLAGAEPLLPRLRWVRVEASDFEVFAGGATAEALVRFMGEHGFREWGRRQFAFHPGGGGMYDIVFGRPDARRGRA